MRAIDSARSLSAFVKSICDIMRRSNCASALQYVPELTWILFLRILDAQEEKERNRAEAVGGVFAPALSSPFRWRDWAAPYSDKSGAPRLEDGKPYGWKRQELFAKGDGKLFDFINGELLPKLHSLDIDPKTRLPNTEATTKQRVIGRIMTAVERVRVDSETNLRDILDLVDQISIDHVDDTHFFTLSQVYEDLLLKMGEKNKDGGQFFTPREVIRAMVRTIDPKLGETIYDPCCGTGGFLAIAYEHVKGVLGQSPASTDIDALKHDMLFGREKENLVFPIALANLVLHGIDRPNIWHGNTLTKRASYAALFSDAPTTFDVVLTNPPFGGKEGKDAQKNYPFASSSTQVLFVQEILASMAEGSRCGMVLDDGFLFRVDEGAFVDTKRKLTDECSLSIIVTLPAGVFTGAGANVKTNLLFFEKGKRTTKIWNYDLSHVKVGKKSPLTLAHFGFGKRGEALTDDQLPPDLTRSWRKDDATKTRPFPSYARLLSRAGSTDSESPYSWTVDFEARRRQARADAQPYLDAAERARAAAVSLKERAKALRRDGAHDGLIEEEIRAQEAASRDAQSEADDIGAEVYDLKAVNPNEVHKTDARTTAEVVESLEANIGLATKHWNAIRELLQ